MNPLLRRIQMILHGTTSKLRPYEQSVLDAWRQHLSPRAESLLNAQLRYLIAYQRQAEDKLLGFFVPGTQSYPGVPSETLFPLKLPSCTAARVHLIGSDEEATRNKVRAEVHLHEGQLISIQFNEEPRAMLARDIEVAKVEVLRDPMIPASAADSLRQGRSQLIADLQSELPEEYLRLVGGGKGITLNHWEVHGLAGIQKILQRNGYYYALAYREGMGAVAVKEDDRSRQLYYLDDESDSEEQITIGFRRFLEEFDGGKVEGRF